VGIATGIAALGAVFQHDISHGMLLHESHRVAFVGAFTSILEIASAIALVGAIAAFALVRSKDFIASHAPDSTSEHAAREPAQAQAIAAG
jgi:hypothetical protein